MPTVLGSGVKLSGERGILGLAQPAPGRSPRADSRLRATYLAKERKPPQPAEDCGAAVAAEPRGSSGMNPLARRAEA